MKRRLLKLTLFLLAGAIINVAVAWGCALWIKFTWSALVRPDIGGAIDPEHGYQHWLVLSHPKPGALIISSQWADDDIRIILSGAWPDRRPEKLIPEWASFARPPAPNKSKGMWHYRWINARGWPALALCTRIACDTTDHDESELVQVSGGIALDQPTLGTMRPTYGTQRFLPLQPLWPGFVINTLIYTAVVWLLVVAVRLPSKIRRTRRRKANLCQACAYSIGTSTICTECGKPIERHTAIPTAKWKQSLICCGVFVLAGLLVNGVLAWSYLALHRDSLLTAVSQREMRTAWSLDSPAEKDRPDARERVSAALWVEYPQSGFGLSSYRVGWPLPAFYQAWGEGEWDVKDIAFLNCRPQWPGLVMNTLFYAAVMWLLAFALRKLRRRIRMDVAVG